MGGVKRFGLVVVGAIAAVLLTGAGSASATLLCTSPPVEEEKVLMCPEKSAYGVDLIPEQEITGGLFTGAAFESTGGPAGTVTCWESVFVAGIKSEGGSEPGEGIMSTTFSSGGGNECESTLNAPANPKVTVTAENLSYDGTSVVYEEVGPPQGKMTVAKAGGAVQIKMNVRAKTPYTCIYKLQAKEELTGKWENTTVGSPPSKLTFTKVKFELSSGAACPTKMAFSAVYILRPTFFELGNIYLAKS
ncbi:MAG TPA: hypothetical protein VLK56_05055 [Solirubrobacterales bacterium]|nr:hypothetical protein [Solirubrobacterales bacterium]